MLSVYPMFYATGNLSTRGTPKVHVNQNTGSVNTGNVLNLDGIRSLVEKLKADMYSSYFIYMLLNFFNITY